MKLNRKVLLGLTTIVASAIPLATAVACGDKVNEDGKYKVGLSLGYAPYDFKITDEQRTKILDGGLDNSTAKTDADMLELEKNMIAPVHGGGYGAGVDVYISNIVASKFKEPAYPNGVVLYQESFPGLASGIPLNAGKFDAIIAGMSKNTERDKVMDFSKAYFTAESGMLVKDTNKETLASAETIKNDSNAEVIVIKGTQQEKSAKKYFGENKVKSFDNAALAVGELKIAGKGAFFIEKPVGNDFGTTNLDLSFIYASNGFDFGTDKLDPTGGPSNIAVANGKETLVATINEIIDNNLPVAKIDKVFLAALDIHNHLG